MAHVNSWSNCSIFVEKSWSKSKTDYLFHSRFNSLNKTGKKGDVLPDGGFSQLKKENDVGDAADASGVSPIYRDISS